MLYLELPVLSTIAAGLLLVPLPSHLRTRNIPALTLILSTCLLSAVTAVNAFVWNGHVRDVAPVWCDIASAFIYSWKYFAVGACLCIGRDLELATSSRSQISTRRNTVLFEVTPCCIIPLISIPIRFVFSSHRYLIVENFGYLTLCLILSVLACMTARNLISHRATMTVGGCSQSALTTPLFVRLVLLCVIKAIWPLLITVTNILLQTWNS